MTAQVSFFSGIIETRVMTQIAVRFPNVFVIFAEYRKCKMQRMPTFSIGCVFERIQSCTAIAPLALEYSYSKTSNILAEVNMNKGLYS